MKKSYTLYIAALFLIIPILGYSQNSKTYDEFEFLELFAGKTSEFVLSELGKPDSIAKKENSGGTVEFWIYHDLVTQSHSDKLYRFTQIGIVNDHIETLGHTNRSPK